MIKRGGYILLIVIIFRKNIYCDTLDIKALKNWIEYILNLEREIEKIPDSKELLFRLTDAYVKIGDAYRAEKYFSILTQKGIDHVRVGILKGDLYWNLQKFDEALNYYLEVISESPYQFYVLSQIWKILFLLKMKQEIQPYYELSSVIELLNRRGIYFPYNFSIKKLDPKKSEEFIVKGFSQLSIGRYEEAILQFQTALDYNPANYNGYKGIGDCYKKLNEPLKAIASYTIYLLLNPEAKDRKEIIQFTITKIKEVSIQ